MDEIKNFLDSNGKLKQYPTKRRAKIYALCYLASKIDGEITYSEKEINGLLGNWHTFDDPATLRRELFDYRLLDRDGYGRAYTLANPLPTAESLLEKYCR